MDDVLGVEVAESTEYTLHYWADFINTQRLTLKRPVFKQFSNGAVPNKFHFQIYVISTFLEAF